MVLDDFVVAQADGYLRRGTSRAGLQMSSAIAHSRASFKNTSGRYVQSRSGDAVARIVNAIKSRYELTLDNDAVVLSAYRQLRGST